MIVVKLIMGITYKIIFHLVMISDKICQIAANQILNIKKIEVDLPTNYVRKVDIEARFDKLEIILSKIFDKLDAKADK